MITKDINQAVQALQRNEVVAIPTETVYGLAGNAYDDAAIRKIFALKNRPLFNPLIVHIKAASALHEVAQDVPDIAFQLAEHFWPGPLTLVLKKQPHISTLVTAGKDTVAVRVPHHPVALELLAQLDFPLAAPSANPFGSISPTSAAHVYQYFGTTLSVVLDGGECTRGVESTIIGFEGQQPVLYRHGSIAAEEIEAVVGQLKTHTKDDHRPDAPGMLSRHYAPATTTFLTEDVAGMIQQFEGKKIGLLCFKEAIAHSAVLVREILSPTGDLQEATKNLYAALHRLDKANLDIIIAERLPNEGLGNTLNDRLQRAVQR